MPKPSPVVHFEMPATDADRVQKFYSEAFSWNMNQMGADMGNYILAGTTETDENMMVKTPGNINGGFWLVGKEEKFPCPHVVISVDHLDESIKAVEEAGGKILGEKMNIPGIGDYVSIEDTEGNNVGMLQSSN